MVNPYRPSTVICGNWPHELAFSFCSKAEGVSGPADRMCRPTDPCVTASRFGVRNPSQRPSSHISLVRLSPKLWFPYTSDARYRPPPGDSHRAAEPSSAKRFRSDASQSRRPNPPHCVAVRAAGPRRPASDSSTVEYAASPSATGFLLPRPRRALSTCISSFDGWAKKRSGCFTLETPGLLRWLASKAANQKRRFLITGPPRPTPHVASRSGGLYGSGVKTGEVVRVAGAVSCTHSVKGFFAPHRFWRSKRNPWPCSSLIPRWVATLARPLAASPPSPFLSEV